MRISRYFYHAWIGVAWFGIGCAAAPKAAPALPRNAAPRPQTQAPIWPKLVQSQSWPKLEHTTTGGGHSGQPYTALLRVNPSSLESYQNLVTGSVLPIGTTLVQAHRDSRGTSGPIYVMEKSQAGWSFSELDSAGHVQREGNLIDCARCHAESVSDSVFGPVRSATLPTKP